MMIKTFILTLTILSGNGSAEYIHPVKLTKQECDEVIFYARVDARRNHYILLNATCDEVFT